MHGLLGQLKRQQQLPSAVVTNVEGADETEELFANSSDIVEDALENTTAISDVFESSQPGTFYIFSITYSNFRTFFSNFFV